MNESDRNLLAEVAALIEQRDQLREERDRLKDEIEDLRRTLEARRRIDKAKDVLMDRRRLAASAAWRWLQKTAMDERVTIAEIAQRIIDDPKDGKGAASS